MHGRRKRGAVEAKRRFLLVGVGQKSVSSAKALRIVRGFCVLSSSCVTHTEKKKERTHDTDAQSSENRKKSGSTRGQWDRSQALTHTRLRRREHATTFSLICDLLNCPVAEIAPISADTFADKSLGADTAAVCRRASRTACVF